MSKTFNALKKVEEIREGQLGQEKVNQDKFTKALSHHLITTQDNDTEERQTSSVSYQNHPRGYIHDDSVVHKQDAKFQNNVLIFLACAGMISLLLSLITFVEIRKTNTYSLTAGKELSVQKVHLNNLEESLAKARDSEAQQETNLKSKFSSLTALLTRNEKKIEDLTEENRRLQSTMADIKWTVQSLTDKISVVSSKVNKLSTIEQ